MKKKLTPLTPASFDEVIKKMYGNMTVEAIQDAITKGAVYGTANVPLHPFDDPSNPDRLFYPGDMVLHRRWFGETTVGIVVKADVDGLVYHIFDNEGIHPVRWRDLEPAF